MKLIDNNLYIGFDIGASSVKWGYGNCQRGLLCFESVIISDKTLSGLQNLFADIINKVDSKIGLTGIKGIGIGTPGTIERKSGKLLGVNPNLQFWTEISPAILIDEKLKLPVVYDNDANLMCLGEASLLEPDLDVVGITIGSGIGSGYVRGGKVFHGSHGFGMELGHITVVADGEPCNCGRKGCLEAYASIEGIKSRAKRQLKYSDALAWNLHDILHNAKDDQRLQGFIQEGERLLAKSLANLCVVLDPDVILLGGGGTEGGLYSLERMENIFSESLPGINRSNTSIRCASLGNKAGVLGAIVLAEREIV
ncbi:MAG: ROK family protein [Candidatus Cloacimonadaceae bacterium]|jgi:glucokinase